MITNIPTRDEFEKVAIENLTQAFNLLFKVYDMYSEGNLKYNEDKTLIDEIWEYNLGTVRTSLILLHQAIEGLMKATICETSPLLLVDKPRKDWPTMPLSEDKDFDSLYTIGGESLLTTFCAVPSSIPRDAELINFIEEIRLKRNQAIHGINLKKISPNYIVERILKTFTLFFGKDVWHKKLKQNIIEDPLYGLYDSDENIISYRFLDFSLSALSKAKLSKHLSLDTRKRAYCCPSCTRSVQEYSSEVFVKWAFLTPNSPDSKTLNCINCYQTFDIIRCDCNIVTCKGNVLFDDTDYDERVCLTCYGVNEE